jgi:hypothetical protein
MNAQFAEFLLCSITAVGAIVWLAGFQFLVRSFPRVAPTEEANQQSDAQERLPPDWICGEAEVDGQPADLIPKAVSALAGGDVPGVGPLKILERGDDRVVVEGTIGDPRSRQSPARVRRAQLHFTSLGRDRTRIEYVAQVADQRWLLRLGAMFQCLGLIALVGGFCTIRAYVVSDPNPGVRWQTFQMLQAGHFLWPVFLLAGLYRSGRRTLQAGLDLLVHNLPYRET